jgi:hypothetical protein
VHKVSSIMLGTHQYMANQSLASRVSWTYCNWEEVAWVGERAQLHQDNSRQKEDLEEAQHAVSLAVSLRLLKLLLSLRVSCSAFVPVVQ